MPRLLASPAMYPPLSAFKKGPRALPAAIIDLFFVDLPSMHVQVGALCVVLIAFIALKRPRHAMELDAVNLERRRRHKCLPTFFAPKLRKPPLSATTFCFEDGFVL